MTPAKDEVKQRKKQKSPKLSESSPNTPACADNNGNLTEGKKNDDGNFKSSKTQSGHSPAAARTDSAVKRQARAVNTSGTASARSASGGTRRRPFDWLDLALVGVVVSVALATRLHHLGQPSAVVFDELHFGKFAGFYMKRLFFFDSQPPLGKQILALAAYFSGYNGEFKFDRIGAEYDASVPVFWLRLPAAVAGSLLPAASYWLLRLLGTGRPAAAVGALMLVTDTALLTQSRFMLMEPFLLLFATLGLGCVVKCVTAPPPLPQQQQQQHHQQQQQQQQQHRLTNGWMVWLFVGFLLLGAAASVRYSGLLSLLLGWYLVARDFWSLVPNTAAVSDRQLAAQLVARAVIVTAAPLLVYMASFYVHLAVLNRAGAHDTIMTSAFQASLEGGLASVIRNQPVEVGHGSQVCLRHTLGGPCWLHSHQKLYPLVYDNGRGSSHQQQVSCYAYKDVNNWWIVKLPDKEDMRVTSPFRAIRDGDTVQLVHGMTARVLNSHDVAAPLTPGSQEVSCYVDYNISMPAQNLWQVQLLNPHDTGGVWHAITSQVRLVHVSTGTALKRSGRQLPDWGDGQGEVVSDKIVAQDATVWNVEEHRYTVADDSEKQQQDLVNTDMLPLGNVELSFWRKFYELQLKMLFNRQETVQGHMYASEPFDWPLLRRGVAYWINPASNGQVYFLGNPVVWALATCTLLLHSALVGFYLLRRRRACYDIGDVEWTKLCRVFEVVLGGYLVNYVPYFVIDHTFFLHHYLPAYLFAILYAACLFDHIFYLLRRVCGGRLAEWLSYGGAICWLSVCWTVFDRFSRVAYGTDHLSAAEVQSLGWRDTWDLIVHKQ